MSDNTRKFILLGSAIVLTGLSLYVQFAQPKHDATSHITALPGIDATIPSSAAQTASTSAEAVTADKPTTRLVISNRFPTAGRKDPTSPIGQAPLGPAASAADEAASQEVGSIDGKLLAANHKRSRKSNTMFVPPPPPYIPSQSPVLWEPKDSHMTVAPLQPVREVDRLKVVGLMDNKAVLRFPITSGERPSPGTVVVEQGQKFGKVLVVAVDKDRVVFQEDGERTVKQLEPIH